MENGQIVYCNLILKTLKGKIVKINKCVFSQPYEENKRNCLKWNNAFDRILINKTKLKEDLTIEKIEIINKVGFIHKSNNYSMAKQNDNNIRNKITGAYE